MTEYQAVKQDDFDLIEMRPVPNPEVNSKSGVNSKSEVTPVKMSPCSLCKKEAVLHKVLAPSYQNYCIHCVIKANIPYTTFDEFHNTTPCCQPLCRNIGACGFATAWYLCDVCDKWKPQVTRIEVALAGTQSRQLVRDASTPLDTVNRHFRKQLGIPDDAKILVSRVVDGGLVPLFDTQMTYRELGIKERVTLNVKRVY